MQKNKIHPYIIIVILVQFLFYCTNVKSQNSVDKNYYLVDSLNLKSYSKKERSIVNDALMKYYDTDSDSLKVKAIYSILKTSQEEDIWGKYNYWLIDFLKSKKSADSSLVATVLSNQGNYYLIKGNYQKSLKYYLESLIIKEQLKDSNTVAVSADKIGDIHKKNGDFMNALFYYNKALKIRASLGEKKEEGQMLNTIGYLHMNFGMHTKALVYFYKSLKVREGIGDKRGVSFCFNNIASAYKKQGDFESALEYYTKSLKVREKIGYKAGTSVTLNNIGVVYKDNGVFDKALEYYEKSLFIKKELKDKKGISHVLNNIGTIYYEQGKLNMSLAKYRESLDMTTALNDEKWMAITLFNMGNLYLKRGSSSIALNHASKSLYLSKKIGQPQLIRDASEVLKKVYIKQGNWKGAFEMQDLFMTMRDSIRNKKTETEAEEQRVNYEVEKKEQEIKLLSVQNDLLLGEREVQQLKINKNRIVNLAIVISMIAAFILAFFFYITFRKSKTINKLLKQQDEEKAVLLKEIHHRVKNNLQVVNSLLRLQSKEIKDQEIVEKFKETQKRVITIAALHEKMYRSDDLRHVNLKDHIESIVEDLVNTYAIDKKIKVNVNIENINIGLRTLVPLGLIINEIIVNSLKYAFINTDSGIVNLQIKQLKVGTFEMLIGDNGIGLKNHKTTSGLGAKLISIFTKQLNGTLNIIEDKGTTYKIIFEKIDLQ